MSTAFILFSAFFPRTTLFLCWLTSGMPDGVSELTPLWLDIIAGLLFPRFLLAYWSFELSEPMYVTALFLLFGMIELLSSYRQPQRKQNT